MSENGKVLNVLFAIALLVILTMNGVLIYRSFTSASQPYILTEQTTSQLESVKQKIIIVSGIGAAATRPNIAVVYLGVKTQAGTAARAQSDNAQRMNSILDALKKDGIADADIETIRYSLEPIMVYPEGEVAPKVVGYWCQNSIAVTLKDISQTGKIIDITVEAGANQIDSIQFKISDEKIQELYDQALKNAIADSDRKADVISKSLNVKLIGPVEISIGSGYEPYPLRFDAEAKAGTPIIPGELKISVNVQVSYQYQ